MIRKRVGIMAVGEWTVKLFDMEGGWVEFFQTVFHYWSNFKTLRLDILILSAILGCGKTILPLYRKLIVTATLEN